MSAHEVFEKWVQLSEQEQHECLLLIQKHVNFCKNLDALVDCLKGMTEAEIEAELEKLRRWKGQP
jgi:RNAse (barnase) inhibitor barstar